MPKLFLADIIGTGEADVDEFRPAVADYSVDYQASIPANTTTGMPLNDWCMVEIIGGDISEMILDARIDALPDGSKETLVKDLNPVQVYVLKQALTRRGIGAAMVDSANSYGDILAAIALRANAGSVVPAREQAEL